jgi:hypothetical protein
LNESGGTIPPNLGHTSRRAHLHRLAHDPALTHRAPLQSLYTAGQLYRSRNSVTGRRGKLALLNSVWVSSPAERVKGGERAAAICSLIGTCLLNGMEP